MGAAGAEPAAGGRVRRGGDVPLQNDAVPAAELAHLGRGGQQRLGVGVQGMAEDGLVAAQLHHLAQVHDGHPVTDVLHHAQIVADEEICQAQLLLQVLQQVQNLGPDGHVQGGHRLVADDQLGLCGQGPGNHDPLALAAGELVGIAVHVGLVEAHHLQELLHPGLPGAGLGVQAPDAHGLLDDLPHRHAGVQGAVGVLEHDLHILAHGPQLALVLGHQVHAVKLDAALGGLDEPQHRPGQGGLAAAGLPHQAQGLPLVEVEGDVVHRLDVALGAEGPALDGEPLAHILHIQQHAGIGRRHLDTSSQRKQRTARPPPMS